MSDAALYRLLADTLLVIHFAFVVFVVGERHGNDAVFATELGSGAQMYPLTHLSA